MGSILRDFTDLADKFKSREWRLENLYWIVDETGKKVRFKLRPAQRKLLKNLHYYNLILKARQLGFTTLIDLLALDMAMFTSNFTAVIIAHKIEDAETIFREKVRDVYNDLPIDIKNTIKATKNEAGQLILSNGSSIKVTTSARSGTCQFLHISEYGKICAKFPDKAKEIRTGSLPAVHPGGFVFIESTAEGNAGHFYELSQETQKTQLLGRPLQKQEFRFHFYPWYENEEYVLEEYDIPDRLLKYFDTLAMEHDIELTEEQMNWYAMTDKALGEDMHSEHPSYPNEAFQVSQEGTYYKKQFIKIYKEKRICLVNDELYVPVYSFWDLGVSDDTGIWFMQFIGKEIRVIDYHEQNGEGLPYYAKFIKDKGYVYGGHFAPHDIAVREFSTGESRIDYAAKLGLKFELVKTNIDLIGGIEQVRTLLDHCYFDERKCEAGIKCLENYRKDWDDKGGIFKAKPVHNWCSHGSDAFRTMAVAYNNRQIPGVGTVQRGNTPQKTDNGGWK